MTNFRSRSEILELTGNLFYQTEIVLSSKDPHKLDKYRYPMAFVCSSVNDSIEEIITNTDKSEAMIVMNILADILKNWNWGKYKRSSLCVMSPSQAQVTQNWVHTCLLITNSHTAHCNQEMYRGK